MQGRVALGLRENAAQFAILVAVNGLVGADNIVTRGKNPFGLPDARSVDSEDEGRVPYVRYQQDL